MGLLKRTFPTLLAAGGTLFIAGLAAAMGAYYYLVPGLPDAETMRDVQLQVPMKVYTRDGKLITSYGEKWRTPVSYDEIPEVITQAFLAAEDDRFFEHPGFDYQGIARAGFNYLLTGSRAQGGSTITQQLAREYFLTRDRTFVRKGKELILALRIESEFTKEEILALYLNKIFLGQRSYGVAAAAERYFGKNLRDITVAEAAILAGLPKAPSSLNPVTDPVRALERRTYVLRRMQELDYITQDAFDQAMQAPVESRLYSAKSDISAPYVAAEASRFMIKRYGKEQAYTAGYKVVTTVDSTLQRAARDALRGGLLDYDMRHGYRGPLAAADLAVAVPALVDPAAPGDIARAELEALLGDYTTRGALHLGVVLTLNKDNSATLYIDDTGVTTLPWERLQRSPYINENEVGQAPDSVDGLLAPGNIVELQALADNNWQLAQTPIAQGSVVAMDPFDGAISATTGGFDFSASPYDRAMRASRQPGSSMKPFVYSAALANGFTAATMVNDAPLSIYDQTLETTWRPRNFDNKFKGPTRLREGLVSSTNLIAIRTIRRTGITNTIKHLKPFGFPDSALPPNASLALGAGGAAPIDMVGAYSALASGGYYRRPYLIERVEDASGETAYQAEPTYVCTQCEEQWFDGREQQLVEEELDFGIGKPEVELEAPLDSDDDWTDDEVINPVDSEVPAYPDVETMIAEASEWRPDAAETPLFFAGIRQAKRIVEAENAYIVYDMMRDVVRRGTGRRAQELGRRDLAGKTGTTNDGVDVWFNGFNGRMAAVAWMGFDDNRSLGRREQGGRTALPMWIDFMRVALAGQPEEPLDQPEGIVSVKVSRKTGELAGQYDTDTLFEIFAAGTEPQRGGPGAAPVDDGGASEDIYGGFDEADDSDIF